MTVERLHSALNAVFRCGVLITLCVAPTQWSLEPRPKLHLSPADLMLAFTAGIWFLDIVVCRDWRRMLKLPPWPHVCFVVFVAVSALTAPDKAAALKDLVQYAEYFLVGSMLFEAYLREGGGRSVRWALGVLSGVTAVILCLALFHYFAGAEDPLTVCGSFGNRNVLGGFLALALPLCGAGLFATRSGVLRAVWAVMLLMGLTVNLSGASYFAVVGVLVCMAAVRGPALFLPVVAGLLVWQSMALPQLPRENDLAHFQSVALYDSDGKATRRYPDWQAAYSMTLTHPWLGVGLGNYQKHVGQYYDQVPRQTGPSEPDIQNLYLVLAASCGLPALFAFLAMLVAAACRAARAAILCQSASCSALAMGVVGACSAFAITAVWHPLLVRGIGLPLVFILALARHLSEPETADGP